MNNYSCQAELFHLGVILTQCASSSNSKNMMDNQLDSVVNVSVYIRSTSFIS
uniref:Uncharacterized protein n=1 Tax=Arion vulgaris TaxID=1028688 RepID=A0A0B7B382_9EUPU